MQITASAVSLTVDDIAASAAFLVAHFGFREVVAADGFAALRRDDSGMDVCFLRRGNPVLPEDERHQRAAGLILAFTVTDLEGELARLRGEGVTVTVPLTVDEWGERSFQVKDPNGVVIELLDWGGGPAPA